jgi:DNA-directed RNA polymerase subunit omega
LTPSVTSWARLSLSTPTTTSIELVLVASNRARKIHSGEDPTVDIDNDKNTVIALREIAEETITVERLKNDLIEEYQTNTFTDDEELNEIEDNSDDSQSEKGVLENDQTIQDQESIVKSEEEITEETAIDTSQHKLDNSSDEDKVQDL